MAGVRPVGGIRRILVAGANGMLGTALQRVASRLEIRVVAPPEDVFDITDEAQVRLVVGRFALEGRGALVNAAAFTDVEGAEDRPSKAYAVNEDGARILARAARDNELPFAHVSTDFVFDGEKDGPYTERDTTNPLSVYGASKLAGEKAVTAEYPSALIARTAWVFGPGGNNFPTKILEAAAANKDLRVVTDEIGSPTYTVDLAFGILGLLGTRAHGLFHLAGGGSCSRHELAVETLRLAGFDVPVKETTSDAFQTKAARPRNSVLDCSKAAEFGVTLPPWRDGLARFVASLPKDRAAEGS